MFQRIQVEEWQNVVQAVGSLLFFVIFLLMLWGVLRISKKRIRHLENLPFEPDEQPTEPGQRKE